HVVRTNVKLHSDWHNRLLGFASHPLATIIVLENIFRTCQQQNVYENSITSWKEID
ncbi:hypothetical protein L9F63_028044, partial [Diploptera punctata]